MKFYAGVDGSDSNSGRSPDHAFRTVGHAASVLQPGDELLLRGGTYVERVRVEHLDGTGAPIVIRSFPGERATIDGTLDEFREAPNGDWELGEHPGEYVSMRTYPPATDHGAFLDRTPYTRLSPHGTLDDLRASNQR